MLVAKIFFVPLMIAAIALLGRRFGARAAGFMSGFPIIGGPIVYFVYWDQGAGFALKAAEATLAGVVGLSSFSFVYAWLAPRAPWWLCLCLGWITYTGLGVWLARADLGAHIYAAIAGVILTAQLRWARPVTHTLAPGKTTTAEIISRMVFAALLVLAVTLLAERLGAMMTGVLAAFPIASSVIAVFSHRYYSPWHAVFALRALKQGLLSLLAFFYALVVLAGYCSFNTAFLLAALAAVLTQICVLTVGSFLKRPRL
ncbi:MAG TPA: hypothetical protein VIZ65_17850 [Cellvibrionaceae bacterium]